MARFFPNFVPFFGSLIVPFFRPHTVLDYKTSFSRQLFPNLRATFPFVVFKFSNGIHPYHIGVRSHTWGNSFFTSKAKFCGGHSIQLTFSGAGNKFSRSLANFSTFQNTFPRIDLVKSSTKTFFQPNRQAPNSLVYITLHHTVLVLLPPWEGHFPELLSLAKDDSPNLPT